MAQPARLVSGPGVSDDGLVSQPEPAGRRDATPRRGLGPRDELVLTSIATFMGLGIAWLDSRPGNDATGVTVVLLLLGAMAVAAASGRRPWLWAVQVGVWVPLFEIGGPAGIASLAALVVSIIGAAIGYLLARLVA